jgi:ribosomal protein S18 acetylase RimI-like enzyme
LPPLTDVIGHLLASSPRVRVRTGNGDVVEFAADDVVAVRALADAPVRTSEIRAVEHAAAMAWPGIEQHELDGWLLRAGQGHTHRANSAIPLGVSSTISAVPRILDWYAARGLRPWLAIPDRLLALPPDAPTTLETRVMVRDLPAGEPDPTVVLSARPDAEWLRVYRRPVSVAVLTAAVDGDVAFGSRAGAAVGRAAVTAAPDGTRWAGLSAVRVADDQRGRGHARALCSALLAWAADNGATSGYVQVLTDNVAAISLYESMGFTTHHRARYVDALSVDPRRV